METTAHQQPAPRQREVKGPYPFRYTVVTPPFNRAIPLLHVYTRLKRQTLRDTHSPVVGALRHVLR